MKYSNTIGAIATLAMAAFCFLPWVYIEPIHSTLTGFATRGTNFGTPGIVHVLFAAIGIVLFLVNKVWAKRANVFFCTLHFAWALRNFILFTRCELGECPEKKAGIYAIVFFSLVMMVMSLLPKLEVKQNG